jgi:hypothetical protein
MRQHENKEDKGRGPHTQHQDHCRQYYRQLAEKIGNGIKKKLLARNEMKSSFQSKAEEGEEANS